MSSPRNQENEEPIFGGCKKLPDEIIKYTNIRKVFKANPHTELGVGVLKNNSSYRESKRKSRTLCRIFNQYTDGIIILSCLALPRQGWRKGAGVKKVQRHSRTKTVLLVDGSTLARLTYRAALEERGYAVEEAGTGREALAKAVNKVYAAVVLNLRLREMSGLGVLETIRAVPGYRAVPVVVLAGGGDAALAEWASELYGARCLLEPFGAGDLAALVDVLVRGVQDMTLQPEESVWP